MTENQHSQPSLIPEIPWAEVHVTVEFIADAYGVTPRAVQLWETDRQWIHRAPRGTFPFLGVIKGVYDGQAAAINKKKGPDGAELESLDLREQRAKTEKAEIEVARLLGDLLPTDEVKKEMFELARRTRDAIENIPSRIAAILAAETNEHAIKETLMAELKQALEGLSK